jgi:hypothetical protein
MHVLDRAFVVADYTAPAGVDANRIRPPAKHGCMDLHGAKAVDLAVNIVIAFNEPDVLDLGTDLDGAGRALDLDGVAITMEMCA